MPNKYLGENIMNVSVFWRNSADDKSYQRMTGAEFPEIPRRHEHIYYRRAVWDDAQATFIRYEATTARVDAVVMCQVGIGSVAAEVFVTDADWHGSVAEATTILQ